MRRRLLVSLTVAIALAGAARPSRSSVASIEFHPLHPTSHQTVQIHVTGIVPICAFIGDPQIVVGRIVIPIGNCPIEPPPQAPQILDRTFVVGPLADGLYDVEAETTHAALVVSDTPPAATLPLLQDRFEASVAFTNPVNGLTVPAQSFSLTEDGGYFWFFDPYNPELTVKMVDGSNVNGSAWVFYGGLTDLEAVLEIRDLDTGAQRTYPLAAGAPRAGADTAAFPLATNATRPRMLPFRAEERAVAQSTVQDPCDTTAQNLCFGPGRYRLIATWTDPRTNLPTSATAVQSGANSGYFWFLDEANVEVVVKLIDGTPINGKHWVFFTVLSGFEVTLAFEYFDATDQQTHQKVYSKAAGSPASTIDVNAF